ncbi:MAG: lipid-A-disaccharide synthase [Candidatus Sumerlaeia bacterium]|nr:lipid-A-disaccharide synthase [Candidatus Sumerlaeia bacterium]
MRELTFYVIAGENSGDLHGANLLKAIKRLYPRSRFIGLGGKQLKAAGMELESNIVNDLAIIGLVGVLQNLGRIRRLFIRTMSTLRRERPDGIILIDYPGYNIRIAARAKKLGIPVIWYISPQVWAWHGSRKFTLAEVVTKMVVIFPFEKPIYEELKMDVEYVGHPLFDVIKIDQTKEEVYAEFALDPAKPLITIVPGSRTKEVEAFLHTMLEGAKRYHERHPDTQFAIIRATTIDADLIRKRIKEAGLPFEVPIVERLRYNLRSHCDFSWVKSGTSTLEAAIMGGPMLIVYRTNYLTWAIGKEIFTIGYIGLPNIVANNRIVPELLQDQFTPQNLVDITEHYLLSPERYASMKEELARVRRKLGGPGASERTALAVLDAVGAKPNEEVQIASAIPTT